MTKMIVGERKLNRVMQFIFLKYEIFDILSIFFNMHAFDKITLNLQEKKKRDVEIKTLHTRFRKTFSANLVQLTVRGCVGCGINVSNLVHNKTHTECTNMEEGSRSHDFRDATHHPRTHLTSDRSYKH